MFLSLQRGLNVKAYCEKYFATKVFCFKIIQIKYKAIIIFTQELKKTLN